jgi:F-type H+-transporting ATPase subunit delta
VLQAVFEGVSSDTKRLLEVLADNSRSNLLSSVATSFIAEYNKIHKIEEATVTTAVSITDELEAKVLEKVRELTGSTDVKLKNTIDESIIGGFVLRVGDMQYNASIASQLGKLKREFNNSL